MVRSAHRLLLVAMILLAELAGIEARAQARDTIAIMRTRYNTFKTQANAQGDLKAKLDKLDQDIARAAQLGRTGELRRLYTQGMALAQNRPWNADVEFAASLAIQTDHVFVDPAPVERSRTMVAELKRLGVEHQYVEVPGGSHGSVVAPNLAGMFDFFDRHTRSPK